MGKLDPRTRGARRVGAAGLILSLMAGAAMAECAPGTVELRTTGGSVMRFSVEVADDAGERATGLMHRERLATSGGMLFVYEAPQHAVFWMKNTLIPLDMIFADSTGRVTHVHDMAIPRDKTGIDGGRNVAFVLEINGGLAGRMGLAPGAVLRHPAVAPGAAAWPCD